MADFSTVPIVDIHNENFQATWPSLLLAVRSSTFIGLDLELSGLGDRKKLSARSIEERYNAICEVAQTRSVLSLGMSCFKLQDINTSNDIDTENCQNESPCDEKTQPEGSWSYLVQTFNITLLCAEDYVVEPISLKFLVDHGFDFNRQYSSGISYKPGNDKNFSDGIGIRTLFSEMILAKKPIVLHNALIDLIFMYHSFYAKLPPTINTFVADFSEAFSGGVYDTKFITEFSLRLPASYLEYVFRKSQRQNAENENSGIRHVTVNFIHYPTSNTYVSSVPCSLQEEPPAQLNADINQSVENKKNVCENFAAHGWCVRGKACSNSHDIDLILDNEDVSEEKKKKRKKRRKHKNEKDVTSRISENTDVTESKLHQEANSMQMDQGDCIVNTNSTPKPAIDMPENVVKTFGSENAAAKPNICINGGHRAGFDAFMTAFAFACIVAKYGKPAAELKPPVTFSLSDFGLDEFMNRICLTGKDIPLQIIKSNFSKTSKDHREKLHKIMQNK